MKIKDDFWEWGQGSQMLWRNQGHAGAGNNQGLVPRTMLRDTRCRGHAETKETRGAGISVASSSQWGARKAERWEGSASGSEGTEGAVLWPWTWDRRQTLHTEDDTGSVRGKPAHCEHQEQKCQRLHAGSYETLELFRCVYESTLMMASPAQGGQIINPRWADVRFHPLQIYP